MAGSRAMVPSTMIKNSVPVRLREGELVGRATNQSSDWVCGLVSRPDNVSTCVCAASSHVGPDKDPIHGTQEVDSCTAIHAGAIRGRREYMRSARHGTGLSLRVWRLTRARARTVGSLYSPCGCAQRGCYVSLRGVEYREKNGLTGVTLASRVYDTVFGRVGLVGHHSTCVIRRVNATSP